ncbi:hypothetical protein [Kitasatospora griseola]|uniref:hypothetical protein n=1 Tax=Kitasatospora griseola TaxID=2064 RepID=UPI00166FCB5B|nr:hypothetical protein [Kitasatospora griseola]GGQ72631.1 hypothetical protein GCM10010195_30250 [Kitasatospora griseola]
MTAQPDHSAYRDDELIPRPEKTPDALRAALAAVAPHRLPEMTEQQDEAFALAVHAGSIDPLRAFLNTWAAHIEVARSLRTAARLREAEHAVQTLERDDSRWSDAVRESLEIFNRAYAAVNG